MLASAEERFQLFLVDGFCQLEVFELAFKVSRRTLVVVGHVRRAGMRRFPNVDSTSEEFADVERGGRMV